MATARNATLLIAGLLLSGSIALGERSGCKGLATYRGGVVYADGGSVDIQILRPCKKELTKLKVQRTLTGETHPMTVDGRTLLNGSEEEAVQLKEIDAIVTRRAGSKSLSEFMKQQLATFTSLDPQDNYIPASALIQSSCASLKTLATNPLLCMRYAAASMP